MKTILLIFTLLSLSTFAIAAKRSSVTWNPDKTWNPSSRYGLLYNTESVEKISGEITEVEEIRPMSQMRVGVHLKLRTPKETLSIHLGPAWYILNQNVKLGKGDTVSIKGSRISLSKGSALVAAQIKKGDEIMQLRDKNGVPYWCAWCIPSSEDF